MEVVWKKILNNTSENQKFHYHELEILEDSDNIRRMYVVEAIPTKGNLQIKTMWKEPTKLIHSNNALHHTSETANSSNSSTLTNNNDTTKTKKVK